MAIVEVVAAVLVLFGASVLWTFRPWVAVVKAVVTAAAPELGVVVLLLVPPALRPEPPVLLLALPQPPRAGPTHYCLRCWLEVVVGEYVHVLLQRVLVEGVGQVFHFVLATQKGLQLPQLDRRIEPISFESLAACWVHLVASTACAIAQQQSS